MRIIVSVLSVLFLTFCSLYAAGAFAYGYEPIYAMQRSPDGYGSVISRVIAALVGAVLGAFLSDKFRKLRWLLFMIAGGLFCVGLLIAPVTGQITSFFIGFVVAYAALSNKQKNKLRNIMKRFTHFRQTVFGSSSWASLEHLQAHNLTGDKGLFLGMYRHREENGTMQDVMIVDPWGIVTAPEHAACFNPMDWLDPQDREINENAMILWDSIIVPSGSKEPFWDDEAKALGVGITLHVATAPQEQQNRTLARVREIIVSGPAEFAAVLNDMLDSPNPIVRSTAMRTAGKDEKLLSNVLATLQSHTHFLDSARLRESMSRSDFWFEDLKTRKLTVYLVLPADRLDTFHRWLRLMIQQAITVNARNIAHKPEKPILFMLDEVAALGKMSVIPRAYGLMAGYGMILWSIVQNLSQLEEIYGKGWETFIGNSGVLQYYGSRDCKSADYFSKLAGVTTAEKFSWSQSISRTLRFSTTRGSSHSSSSSWSPQGGSSSSNFSTSTSVTESESDSESDSETKDVVQRALILPDELMVLRRDEALVLVENLNPIKAFKVKWFEHPLFRNLGVNLERTAISTEKRVV